MVVKSSPSERNLSIRPSSVENYPRPARSHTSTPLPQSETTTFESLLRSQVESEEIKISSHAAKRIHQRNINMDSDEFLRLKKAVDILKNKGGKDSLIITKEGAYIVDVDKSVVVTAMDKESIMDNVFTKIDSTLIVN